MCLRARVCVFLLKEGNSRACLRMIQQKEVMVTRVFEKAVRNGIQKSWPWHWQEEFVHCNNREGRVGRDAGRFVGKRMEFHCGRFFVLNEIWDKLRMRRGRNSF